LDLGVLGYIGIL